MQLREIHIDSFGVLSDKHVTGLSSGINVIHGSNEFGKTTLLDFIRRILFGFPDRRFKGNLYRVPGGGAHCGRLVCQLANGKTVIISRREGTDGGPVKIAIDSTKFADQKELNRILDGVGGGFYQNVYAIDLDELGRKKSLEEDEVENHIYGAGLGLSSISLKGIKDHFEEEAEKLFIPPGRARKEMPQRYDEIRELEKGIRHIKGDLSKYDELVSQLDELNETVNSLNKQISTLEENKRKLENQKNLYQTYVDLSDAVVESAKLGELPLFTEGARSELETLKGEIDTLGEKIKEETGELEDLESQRDSLVYDEQIIVKEPDILTLLKKSDDFRKASTDIKQIETDRDEHDKLVKEGIERVGHGWTKENVRDFNLSVLQKDKIRTTKANLDEAERKLREQSKGLTAPALLKYLIYFVTALGLICAVSGFVAAQTLVAVLSTTIFVVGVGLILFMLLSKRPGEEYQELLKAKNSLQVEWREFLGSINFDGDLSPDGVQDLVNEINGIKSQLELLATAEDRIKSMQATIAKVETLHNQVAVYFDKSKVSDDIAANIDIFSRLLDEAKGTKRDKEGLIKQIDRQNNKIKDIKKKKHLAEEGFQSYISSLGANDEADFKLKYQTFMDRKGLEAEIDTSIKIIQGTVGIGEHFDSFIESISSASLPEIESKLSELTGELQDLKNIRDQDKETIGQLRSEIERLSSSADLLVKQNELEIRKQQLRDYASDWVRAQIVLFVRDKAISKYETDRQPKVIKAAKDVFANITDHSYSTIIIPAGTKDFTIRDSYGKSKTVKEMSRGTKEQLYFAMRLGLIEVYEAEKEPMPIIMDDILVNFDDDRGPLAIKELAKFARDRQVVVLTCHKNALDLYKSLGAKEITFD